MPLTPPPFALWPVQAPPSYPHPPQSSWRKQLALNVVDWVGPFLDPFAAIINGWLFYGYPRHLFASIFARPFLIPASPMALWGAAIPRNVIALGPLNADVAVTVALGPVKGEAASTASIDMSELVPVCREQRPLVSGAGRVLYAAFGTHVKFSMEAGERLCTAFCAVLDSGKVDAVLFSRRLLGAEDAAEDAARCSVPASLLAACNDSRIWSTTWVRQREVLSSGAVGLFVSHGGYNSLQEVSSAQVPFAVLPFFADQPDNADIMDHGHLSVELAKADDAASLAAGMMKVSLK